MLALVGARHIVHVSRIRVKSHPPFASIGRSSPYCPRRVRVKSSGKLASAIFEQSFRNLIAVLMSDLYLFRSFYIWHKETKSDLMAVVSSHTPSGQLYFFWPSRKSGLTSSRAKQASNETACLQTCRIDFFLFPITQWRCLGERRTSCASARGEEK